MRFAHRRQFLHLATGAATLPALSRFAWAQAYPARPIHLVIGFTPGAATDVIGRLFAKAAEPRLGQQIVVENRPGAGSKLAAQYVAHSAKDGYTLFVSPLSSFTNEIVNPSPSFDLNRDLMPVALLANGTIVLAVSPATKVRSVAELIALAKQKPGELISGTVGAGTLPHLCSEMFAQRAGVKLTHVPFPGTPQIATELMAGRVSMSFIILSSVLGQLAGGQITALATAADKRSSAIPDVPTMAEAGMPDFDTSLWIGLLAPAGTPRPVIETVAAAARQAMHAPDTLEMLHKQGYEPLDAGPDEFAAFIRSEIARWSAVANAAGLKS
jgi:tripartite-type tricarboxylate transporter receptor subunit TctC